MLLIRISLLAVVIITHVRAQNYCDRELCSGRRHIACDNNGNWETGCDGRMIDVDAYSNLILQLHNERRNIVASGRLSGFPSAAQMATMTWDPELSRVAAFNGMRCHMEHDECRNTRNFRYAGQNLSIFFTRDIDINTFIRESIENWFNEHRNTNRNDMERYQPHSGPAFGHFTTMVNERNSRIGCAISQFTSEEQISASYLVCNYAVTNIRNARVYRFGDPASECSSGRNEAFDSLCSIRERYNHNEWSN